MCMVATAHAYYNVQHGRILHSCSMEHYYYAHLEYRINMDIAGAIFSKMNVFQYLQSVNRLPTTDEPTSQS